MTLKLVANNGRWSLRDKSMIFGNVVWLVSESDIYNYQLINGEGKIISYGKSNEEYLIKTEEEK